MSFGTYRQYDSRWGTKNYNGSSNYATAGCGPTSCANVLYAINPSITPLTTGNWLKSKGYAIRNQGTSWNGIPACLKAFGATDVQEVEKMADIFSYCSKGYVGVFLFRKGTKGGVTWTTSGHFVMVYGYKHTNGKHYFKTFDSGGRKHDGWYCYETQMKGLIRKVWLCKATQEEIKPITKPSGKYGGTIAKPTLKKGSKGAEVTNLQKFLTWYGIKCTTDGNFGAKTETALKVFQKTEGIGVDGVYGNNSYKHAKTYEYVEPTKKGYTGTFPSPNTNTKIVNGMAYRMCYPYGTAEKKYKYSTGKPKAEYKAGIDKIYPNHKSWSNARQRVGACCDVFVGVCLGYVGIIAKKDLKDQLKDFPKNAKLKSNGHAKAGEFKLGDVVQRGRKDYSGHTWVVCELVNGKKYVANSHYKKLKGCYAVMDAKPATIVPSKWKYYKCYTVQGAIRTDYRKGDYGYDVLYIQKFLKWYGYAVSADGDFGAKTEDAVKKFQAAEKLTVDGKVGANTIEKMKAVRK